MKDLKKLYAEWREVTEELIKEGNAGSVDCGIPAVREDFTAYADLNEEIKFEEMLDLEKEYKEEKQGFTTLVY